MMMPWRTTSTQGPRRTGVTFQAWNIYLHGQLKNTVFLNAIAESGGPDAANTVKQSLVGHGYDDRIVVRLWRCIPLHQVVFCGLRIGDGARDGGH
jgi:hypothetical protein